MNCVPDSKLVQYDRAAREDGFSDFQITEREVQEQMAETDWRFLDQGIQKMA